MARYQCGHEAPGFPASMPSACNICGGPPTVVTKQPFRRTPKRLVRRRLAAFSDAELDWLASVAQKAKARRRVVG